MESTATVGAAEGAPSVPPGPAPLVVALPAAEAPNPASSAGEQGKKRARPPAAPPAETPPAAAASGRPQRACRSAKKPRRSLFGDDFEDAEFDARLEDEADDDVSGGESYTPPSSSASSASASASAPSRRAAHRHAQAASQVPAAAEGQEDHPVGACQWGQQEAVRFGVPSFVWAKMRSYPWWPALRVGPGEAPENVVREPHDQDCVLVRFFGSEFVPLSAWLPPKSVVPFRKHFGEYSSTSNHHVRAAIAQAEREYTECCGEWDRSSSACCEVCRSCADEENMLFCDWCDCGYHKYCHRTPISQWELRETEKWYCSQCVAREAGFHPLVARDVSRIRPGVVGLQNIGLSCFMNSLLQCLNAVTPLRLALLGLPAPSLQDSPFLSALYDALAAIRLPPDDACARRTLQALKVACGRFLAFKYLRYQQQDISEFTLDVLDGLQRHLSVVLGKGKDKDKDVVVPTVVDKLFDGELIRVRECAKGHAASSTEPFKILTVLLPQKTRSSSGAPPTHKLEDLLHKVLGEDTLQCRCSECGGNKDFTFDQRTYVNKFPKVLVLHLARFNMGIRNSEWWSNKISDVVTFPLERLDMRFWASPSLRDNAQTPIYNLVAIANHGGGTDGGHYWVHMKDSETGKWFLMNDETAKEVPQQRVVTPNAYMLVYELPFRT
eukprot:m51a1_g1303 putative ubiquitin carboxyl-terminal hydrolase 2 isoform x1 (667) ;mRNA; r:202039-204528